MRLFDLTTHALGGVVLSGAALVLTVDRIEGARAVVEWTDGTLTPIPIQLLPPHAREGDHLRLRWQRVRLRRRPKRLPDVSIPMDFSGESPRSAASPKPSHAPSCAPMEPSC